MLETMVIGLVAAVVLPAHPLGVISAPPGARVEVRGQGGQSWEGTTPWRLELPPGTYEVRIEMPGFVAEREIVELSGPAEVRVCLNEASQKVPCLRIMPCGGKPKGVFVNQDGSRVWAALLPKKPSVQIFNGHTGDLLETIQLDENGGVELLPAPDGKRLWVSQMQSASVYEIHRETYAVLRRFDTGGMWSKVLELSRDEKSLYVANWLSNDVSEIDLASGELRRRIPTVKTPRGLYVSPDGRHLYVAGFKRGEVQKINLRTGKGRILRRTGGSVRHFIADEKRNRLYISDMGTETVFVLDLENDRIRRLASTIEDPNTIALSPDGKLLFVSTRGKTGRRGYMHPGPEWGAILVIDAQSGDLLDTIVGGNQPTALAVSGNGRYLVSSDFLDRVVRVFSLPTYEKLAQGPRPTLEELRPRLKKPNHGASRSPRQ